MMSRSRCRLALNCDSATGLPSTAALARSARSIAGKIRFAHQVRRPGTQHFLRPCVIGDDNERHGGRQLLGDSQCGTAVETAQREFSRTQLLRQTPSIDNSLQPRCRLFGLALE
jgi:hypothetical protein